MNPSHQLLLALICLTCMVSCEEKTQFAPGYSKEAFAAVKVGDDAASVLAKLGPPVRTRLFSTDYPQFPLPAHQQFEMVESDKIIEKSREAHRYLYLEYSIQVDGLTDWRRNGITIKDGKVTKIHSELVTE